MDPSPLAHSIVDNGQLSTADLISTLLMYLTAPTVSDDEERYRHYTLCKPALLRLHAEDAVGFVRVAKRIKEQLGIPVGDIKRDMALLWATQASAQVPQGSNPDDGQGLVVRLATAILDTDHFAQDAGGRLFAYSNGVYTPFGEQHLRRRVKEL